MNNAIQSFDAETKSEPKVLILGSIPGVASLNAHQYYAHPRNAFWSIMCRYFGLDEQSDYEHRLAGLLDKNIALWDVLGRAERQGSLDSAINIQTEQANPIDAFITQHTSVEAILFNGGKAESSFKKVFAKQPVFANIATHKLPSTSPAFAAMSFEQKCQQWHQCLSLYF
ncbi:DNA-deoxyinosine glycosylase [Reinekea marina]|uniref:DNA-deoxyinosine glycosylase n=2 Tax=Reinekea marina TaxID=1310421 RepID=A0ABV7WR40_9GAMM|nr:DNA-deoxyinosine glycosylase [Reinekea marina]MDN3651051.1 DNA-deoxyinosine glycosylase [Reinekea marina]